MGITSINTPPGFRLALARYDPDGSLDTTFGTGGLVSTDTLVLGEGVALQDDGKIVVSGVVDPPFAAVARFNSDGTLDMAFGTAGLSVTSLNSSAGAVAIQADGKIVVAAGSFTGPDFDGDFAVARFNTDGSLDPTFGTDGQVITDFASGSCDNSFAIAVQADGKILVAGSHSLTTADFELDFALARYNTDGSLDATFGTGGLVVTDFGSEFDEAFAIAIQANGRIIAAGNLLIGTPTPPPSTFNAALARYDTDGSLDATFGVNGLVTTDFAAETAFAVALAIQSDGKILAVGGARVGGSRRFALARYLGDPPEPILPAMSQWGVVVLLLLMLTGLAIKFRPRLTHRQAA